MALLRIGFCLKEYSLRKIVPWRTVAGAVPEPFLHFNCSQLLLKTKHPESARALPLCWCLGFSPSFLVWPAPVWSDFPAQCTNFLLWAQCCWCGAGGFPVLHLGSFSLSWFGLFEPVNSRLYFTMWINQKWNCSVLLPPFATASLSKSTLRCVSENWVQREPLERAGNNVKGGE